MHVVNEPITSNISQKCQTFSLGIFNSRGWYLNRDLFKYLFHLLLIFTTTPCKKNSKTLIQVSMKLITSQRETREYVVKYFGWVLTPPKSVASVDLSFSLS